MEGVSYLHHEINTESMQTNRLKMAGKRGSKMRAFIDDLAGAIHDLLGWVSYFLAGVLIVSVVMYLFVFIIRLATG